MRVGSIAYLPPKGICGSEAFLANVFKWKPEHPFYFYSDDPFNGVTNNIIANPEIVKSPRHAFAVQNLLWLFGLKLAIDIGLDYFIYVEADCRFHMEGWDEIMLQDHFRENKTPLVSGTPVQFNVSQSGPIPLRRSIELAYRYQSSTGFLSPIHGAWPGSPTHFLLFPNGALGVYQTKLMADIFMGFDADIGRFATTFAAWDHEVGRGLWNRFKEDVFDQFQFSTQSYSGYGDSLFTFAERGKMLTDGKVVGVHQIKTSDTFL
jgi:hypothetical protein